MSDEAAAAEYFEIMSRYSLIQSIPQEFEFLRRVHHTTLKGHITEIWGWDESQQDSYVAEDFESGQIQIIQFNGQKIGYLHLTQDIDILFIANILILPEFQSLGIGSEIIDELAVRAKNEKLRLRLGVFKINSRARKLYERLQFNAYAETATHFLMERNEG